MDISNQELAAAAAECDDCRGWLEHCHAECCRDFTFAVGPASDVEFADDTVRVRASITWDVRRYLELHGAQVDDDCITVPREAVSAMPDRLVVRMQCRALTRDDQCALHDGRQPLCCSGFTRLSASSGKWVVPPECRFAFAPGAPRQTEGELLR
ncbi:MAG: hypothetical protein P4L93_04040 [Coriobacteriia bacterium]|nr:hypothetical protein [Coriobacteriia bacterium]